MDITNNKSDEVEIIKKTLLDIRKKHEKTINYHIQTNREQYVVIKKLEQGISETTAHYEEIIEKTIQDKDAYAEQIIQDKDAYAEQIIKEKDVYIGEIKNVIKDKDAYAEQIIQDKDAYAEQIIKDKDAQLEKIQDSTAFKLLKLLDKIRNKNNS